MRITESHLRKIVKEEVVCEMKRPNLPGPIYGPHVYKTTIVTDAIFDTAIESAKGLAFDMGASHVDYFGGWSSELESLAKETKFPKAKLEKLRSLVEAGSELDGELVVLLGKHATYAEQISALAEDLVYHAYAYYREK